MRGLGLATIVTAAGAVLLSALPAAASGQTAAPGRTGASGWRSTDAQGVVSNLTLRNG